MNIHYKFDYGLGESEALRIAQPLNLIFKSTGFYK